MEQLDLFDAPKEFILYHYANPEIYREFEKMTLQTIRKGFSHYGSKAIFELIRWHTPIGDDGEYKVNNNYTAHYARMFERKYPRYAGFFRKRVARADEE
jgi:hypothetical protein